MNKRVAIILGNYKHYAEKYFPDCIKSIRDQNYEGEIKIFIYDNETSSGSFEFLSKNIPEAELVLNKTNDGFAKGNNDAIKLALAEGFDYVILFNSDTIIEKSCVTRMVEAVEDGESIGAVQARLMLHPETEKINSVGNATHFLGFGYSEGYGEVYEETEKTSLNNIAYPSGAAVLFAKEVLDEVGLLDEEFWMYNEDQDLGWRIWLAGYKCVVASGAVVYHKYEFSRSVQKYYWMDRNRIIAIIKNYHILTLILILPAFLIMELGLILFSLKSGWFKEKVRAWKYFFTPKTLKYLFKARRKTQKLRKVKDRDIATMITGKIWYQEIDDWKLRFINPVFNFYWNIVKKIIVW